MTMQPMSTFNPDGPCLVHDILNRKTFRWKLEWADDTKYAKPYDHPGIISWDGLLLDGWSTFPELWSRS